MRAEKINKQPGYRQFFNSIHMGCSEPHCTEAQMLKLQDGLREAFSTLSGMQQPPMATDSEESCLEWRKLQQKGRKQLVGFVRDVAMAFTGCNITFTEGK